MTCWDCYDFEAAAAHEIGHLLGLGQPDLAPLETYRGFQPLGRNAYHVGLAAGIPMNETSCLYPWADVRVGVPPGAELDPQTGIRPSIMSAFTRHNPRTCLTADDLEALTVLYPDCMGAPIQPVCNKVGTRLGWLRVLMFVEVPLLVALTVALASRFLAWRKLRKQGWRLSNPGPTAGGHGNFRRASTIDVNDLSDISSLAPQSAAQEVEMQDMQTRTAM